MGIREDIARRFDWTITLLALFVLACGPSATDPSVDGSVDDGGADGGIDAGIDADMDCHWDCFGSISCADGVVTRTAHMPIPCSEWTGSCPSWEDHTCTDGCRADRTSGERLEDSSVLCEENRPRSAGDPCDMDDDCLPTPAREDDEGRIVSYYLRCEAGSCVTADPPVVSDWYEPCGADLSDVSPGAYGYVGDATCSGGVCLILGDASCAAAFRQGCSTTCSGDHECPPGTRCESEHRDHLGGPAVDVCVPASFSELPCPGA